MSTYEQMRTNIADYMARSDLNSQIDQEINRAVAHYAQKEFWFNQNVWGFKLKPDTESMTLASASIADVAFFNELTLKRTSTDVYPLDKTTLKEIRLYNQSDTSDASIPRRYAIFANRIYMTPVPDSSYSVDVYGVIAPATLSASGDTNVFLSNAGNLIESHVMWRLYTQVLMDNERGNAMRATLVDALAQLEARTSTLQATGRLQPWC